MIFVCNWVTYNTFEKYLRALLFFRNVCDVFLFIRSSRFIEAKDQHQIDFNFLTRTVQRARRVEYRVLDFCSSHWVRHRIPERDTLSILSLSAYAVCPWLSFSTDWQTLAASFRSGLCYFFDVSNVSVFLMKKKTTFETRSIVFTLQLTFILLINDGVFGSRFLWYFRN